MWPRHAVMQYGLRQGSDACRRVQLHRRKRSTQRSCYPDSGRAGRWFGNWRTLNGRLGDGPASGYAIVMSRQASLSTKLTRIGACLLLVALASISLTLWVTWQLEGGAAAVNEAGRMRMQTGAFQSTCGGAVQLSNQCEWGRPGLDRPG